MRACLILLVAACTTTRTVGRSGLDAIAERRVGDGVVLHSTSVWKTRLDPMASVRFCGRDGCSSWLEGRQLYANEKAVYVDATVDIIRHATKIEIRGLAERDRESLAVARPVGAVLTEGDGGVAVMQADSKGLDRWVTSFFDIMRAEHVSYEHLRYKLRGAPLGTWTVSLPNRDPLVLAGQELYERIDDGLATRHGYRWQDIERAEVKSLSGSLTLTAIIATTAVTVALLPVALLCRGLPLPGQGPRGGNGGAGGGSTGLGGSGGRVAVEALGRVGGSGEAARHGDWNPMLADRDGMAAPRLFSAGARRRAMVRVAATAEVSVGSLGEHALLDGGAGVVRIGQAFELGAGGLHLLTHEDGRLRSRGLAFARIGAHLPIDAAHRIAVPLSIDIGGGGGEALGVFTRLNWGARIKLGEHSFVGVSPLTPTLLNWKHDPGRRRGSLTTGLELGLVW